MLEVTVVGNADEERRAAAACEQCGKIGIVRIRPDGRFHPLGQSSFCDCEPPTLRVLEIDPDSDEFQ